MVKSIVLKRSASSSLASSTSLQNEAHNSKNRNDPGRFFGDGVQFKAKLIGILEVGEARGDRMCQEALQDLKMAIRAAGEHKQRITIHVTIDGLRLRDEKTSDSLYHHPVHKISFIAQDMTDSRAFGYIFGSPDSGHRFFGIKTDKAASQVVLAMRDLFQVVFELKKKEIELARQQIQSKTIHEHQPLTLSVKNTSASEAASILSGNSNNKINNLDGAKSSHVKEMSPESVADLVDLEQELSSIQRGITQMERITPSEPTPTGKSLTDEDPFGDSFTNFPTYNLLPPPESTRSRHSKPNKPPDSIISSSTTTTPGVPSISNLLTSQSPKQNQLNTSSLTSATDNWLNDLDQHDVFDTTKAASIVAGSMTTPVQIPSSTPIISGLTAAATPSSSSSTNVANTQPTPPSSITTSTIGGIGITNSSPPSASVISAVQQQQNDDSQLSGEDYLSSSTNNNKYSAPPNALLTSTNDSIVSNSTIATTTTTNNSVLLSNSVKAANATHSSQYIDAFSDLDPLGTGRIRPYVDKKYFFQELKNPPKKVLKDLSGPETSFTAQFVSNSDGNNDVPVDEVAAAASEADLYQTIDAQTSSLTTHSCSTKGLNLNFTHNFAKADSQPTDPVMLPRDTDPFSPTRKKSDPFPDGDIFGKLDPFEFEFPTTNGSGLLPETKITTVDDQRTAKKDNMFNGPLQVNLPPESGWTGGSINQQQHRRVERQASESPTAGSRNRPSVFKQNTVDVISSISSKKMPHLFGQKFSKRDSNSINMRRLQESDSLSENEAAPEPPPRPDSASHAEPPPLPPKKQFSDIVIRPRITPPPSSNRYESIPANKARNMSQDAAVPPIPLPSRRIVRSEGTHPGPGRPRKPGNDEDDYLQPISGDVPPLLPPPQTRGRLRRQEIYENKTEAIAEQATSSAALKVGDDELEETSILPDITLSQLLTLGIDELATKLSVPTSKLSTMTLVELTSYLSEFIEKSKKPKPKLTTSSLPPVEDSPPIFKVNFDQMPDATFVAKFDDNFGEEDPAPFVANFSQFENATAPASGKADETPKPAAVPPADRYAVFREIIDQELHQDSIDQKSSPEADDEAESLSGAIPETNTLAQFSDEEKSPTSVPVPKIDTKITEAISHAKDRYAALRDIILVEDLFEKPPQPQHEDLMHDFPEFSDDFNSNTEDVAAEDDAKSPVESSPESNQNEEEDDQASSKKGSNKFLHTLTVSSTTKDDLEIDELMNRAISNLSLDSREHLSPNNATTKSPAALDNNIGSPHTVRISPLSAMTNTISTTTANKSQFNDMSTSPIPLQKSPAPIQKSPLSKSPVTKSPIPPQLVAVSNLIDASKRLNSGSLSDVVCISSPDADTGLSDVAATKPITGGKSPKSPKESWATFEKNACMDVSKHRLKSPKVTPTTKDQGESPCSSDGKEDWNRPGGEEYNKRWPKGQTSSSSRDLSPWDDEASDYKKRIPPAIVGGADRHGYYMRHARRMNSCDEDYEYEEEMSKRRERKIKTGISRSRENFEFDSPQWYHTGPHHTWSPQDEEGRARSFDRGAYERTTYGPPVYDKRDHKIPSSHVTYDRRDYKGYEKRKYYRDYMRPAYDFDGYGESPDTKERKVSQYYGDGSFEKMKPGRRDYENIYEENFGGGSGPRSYKSRDYIYDRERKSFDRDSVESYESSGRRRKSFGSGEVYGSLESREEFRERYMGGPEKTRSLRKGMKMRLPAGGGGSGIGVDDYDQDSETEVQTRRVGPLDTRSLQRPSQGPQRMRKSSGSSPWDGEEPPPTGHGQKGWKRPSSASESERRLAESRRGMGNTPSGSDGEKDRRFRKKSRSRSSKEIPSSETRPTQRYGSHRDNYDYINYEDYDQPTDEDKFERLNRRRHEMHQRMMESERRQKPPSNDKYNYDDDESPRYMAKKEQGFYSDKVGIPTQHKHEAFDEPAVPKSINKPRGADFDFDDYEDTPRSNTSSKFNFEEHGFESDFNSPPPASCNSASTTTPATKSSFRFSNDFSEKEKQIAGSLHSVTTFDSEFSPAPPSANNSNCNTAATTTQKLRFDDRVTVSKFDNDQPSAGGGGAGGCCDDAFEDDFSKAEFDFEKEDQWNPEPPKKNNLRMNSKLQQRQEMIKKSESINIFAKKNEDPFEDDEFFKSPPPGGNGNGQAKTTNMNGGSSSNGNGNGSKDSTSFQWESNFAKFDENM